MQKIFIKITILLFLVSFQVHSGETSFDQYTYLAQNIDISTHQNKKFKLSVSVRKEVPEEKESTHLFVSIIDDSESQNSLQYKTSGNKQLIKQKWSKFTIEDTIDVTAKKIGFGLMCMDSGKIFFDDFKLEIQNEDGTWEQLQLKNPDFEENFENKEPIWGNEHIKSNKNFTTLITNENPHSGNYCLVIEGKNIYGKSEENGDFVAVNGVKLYYEIYGEGKPLLLLHGSGQSISAFTSQIDFFSKHYKVIALDSRGRGRSTDNDEELTYVNQAKDVNDFLDELHLDSVSIIGWSDGGIIGLIMAMKYPEKVNKLVAMGANIYPDGLLAERLQLHKETVKKLEMDEKNTNTINYKLFKLMVDYPQLKFDDLKSITSPTLIMAGDHDLIKDMHTVKIFQAIPNANLAIFPGETHWFPASNSKLFNSTVFDFLQKEFKKPKRF
ncbi:Arylesterase [Kordia antarctica]|uniref:Arylesterase n=1 Tax=Kordia antarctica TaxID=1218801 RepID=A0A7L4ZGP1_9FLAO|nr:alpha/beta hydrolase [Kordia antarctica]QHI35084.1 Arylesterase [Kordia antarctica]